MALAAKIKLGPYEIVSQLGAGGMGEVYRARDTRLERFVAIKVLPSAFSNDPSLKQRFEREARTISSLTHPHICTLHDLGHENGIDYLVMEYLEGQTLAERLSKGPIPLEEGLKYAVQICEALDKAHRQGIVHRDLKPGNIMVTKHGVKLLDFGLAKWMPNGTSPANPSATLEVTAKESITEQGSILGTLQYMSPEQLEGKEADARSDIFAFGAVLYEMATGRKAFTGKSRASLIAAILERQPERLSQVAPLIPPALERLVGGCLAKDPDERWQTAHDLKLQLMWILEGGSETGVPKPVAKRRRHRELIAWSLAALLMFALAYLLFASRNLASSRPLTARFEIQRPDGREIGSIALSPSGRKLAIVSYEPGGNSRLWIRSKDSFSPQAVPNDDYFLFPFWSPDENSIGFFTEDSLKRFDLNTGAIVSLCKVTGPPRGGTWSSKGVIVFASSARGAPLYRVSASGGEPNPITQTKPSQTFGHRWPWFLEDGEHFLYWAQTDSPKEAQASGIFISSLATLNQSRFLIGATERAIVSSGHLLFVNNGVLMAAPFDSDSKKLEGAAFPVAETVETPPGFPGLAIFSASQDGSLAFLPRTTAPSSQLSWYNLNGDKLSNAVTGILVNDVRLSPNAKLASVTDRDPATGTSDIWIHDLERNSSMRLTSNRRENAIGIWSPDGKRIVFTSDRKSAFDLYIKEVESIEPERLLFESAESKFPLSWSPDGKRLLFLNMSTNTKWDVWMLPMDVQSPKAEPFLNSQHNEGPARFSPDGKWVLYSSDEGGARGVFAISFPDRRGKIKISNSAGRTGYWSPDGTTIYYQDLADYMVEVPVTMTSDRLIVGVPRRLFQIRIPAMYAGYDIAPDGKRFLISTYTTTNASPIKMVLNWPLEFQKK